MLAAPASVTQLQKKDMKLYGVFFALKYALRCEFVVLLSNIFRSYIIYILITPYNKVVFTLDNVLSYMNHQRTTHLTFIIIPTISWQKRNYFTEWLILANSNEFIRSHSYL